MFFSASKLSNIPIVKKTLLNSFLIKDSYPFGAYIRSMVYKLLRICLLTGLCFALSANTSVFCQNIDSLKTLLEKAEGKKRVDLLDALSFAESQSYPSDALAHAAEAFNLATELNYAQGQASSLHKMAVVYRFQGFFDKAIQYGDSALGYVKNQNAASVSAAIYSNQGVSYRSKGEYENALESFQRAMDLHKSLGQNTDVAIVLNNLGVMYMYMEDYLTSLSYYEKALAIQREENNQKEVANILNNFAIVYANQGMLDSALTYFQQSLAIEKELENLKGISESINNIGAVYYYLGNTDMAIAEFKKSYAIDSLLGDERGMILGMNNIAEILNETGQPVSALKILKESLKKARAIDSKVEIETAYANMANSYQLLGNYEEAFNMLNLYSAIHDTVLGEQKQSAIAEMETQYQTREKEQQIRIQNLEIEEQAIELNTRNKLIIGLISGLILLVLTGFMAYRAYKSRKESELQRAIALEQAQRLDAVIDATEQERTRVAKELHDGIGQQLTSIKLGMSNFAASQHHLPEGEAHKIKILQKVVDESARDVRELSHQMMPKALTEIGLEPALRDMLSKSLSLGEISYTFDAVNTGERLSPKIEVNLYRIAQELVNNIIKHSEATVVKVELVATKRSVEMNVEDNGKGLSADTGDGHGLMNIKTRVNHIKGVISFLHLPKGGSRVEIRVPINEN